MFVLCYLWGPSKHNNVKVKCRLILLMKSLTADFMHFKETCTRGNLLYLVLVIRTPGSLRLYLKLAHIKMNSSLSSKLHKVML